VADRVRPLPPRGRGYFTFFRQLRTEYPDVWLLFTNSFRGDLEGWLTGCRQRFGLVRPGKWRPILSHRYRVPSSFNEGKTHQLDLWANFLQHFGLAAPLDRTPTAGRVPPNRAIGSQPIGLIPGSENTPEKRWPVAHWRTLIEAFPEEHFLVFGTPTDVPIATAVSAGFAPERVSNLAGKTDLPAFARQLNGCRVLVTNDTGGMHLANALGVPLIGLFGPTNPIRTGPVFSAPAKILQPPGCPTTGGGSLSTLAPETVVAILRAPHPASVS
jgi:heptosyltransferase II